MKLDKFVICDQAIVKKTLFINLFTIRDCNNKCWYCIENIKSENSGKYITPQLFDNIIEFIDKQEKEYLSFHFYGGEPTLNAHLFEYIEILNKRYDKVKIKLSTNLMQNLYYYDRKLPTYVKVWASLHTDHVLDHAHWMEKANLLNDKGQLSKVFLMAQDDNYKKVASVYKDWENLPIYIYPIDIVRFRKSYRRKIEKDGFREHDPYEDHNYLDILIDGLKYEGIPTVKEFNSFRGMLCNAGYDIDESGKVTYCGSENQILLDLGNQKPKKLTDRYHLCECDECPCDPEFAKYSMPYFLKHIYKKGDEVCISF